MIGGIVWVLSWTGLYLEIFRWHHVTRSLHLNPPPSPPGTDIHPHPGGFLIVILVGSVVGPLAFGVATAVDRVRARPRRT